MKSLTYRKWEFDLLTFNGIINGKYKVFITNFSVFPIINISYRKIIEKLHSVFKSTIINIILTTVSGKTLFFHRAKTMWKKLPQDLVRCAKLENCRLELKSSF